MNYDITFCSNKKCEDTNCVRHPSNTPKNTPTSIIDLKGVGSVCPTYESNSDTLLDVVMKNENNIFTEEQLKLIKEILEG